ncbi:ribulose-phosphate 3-epimerase [Candidatus Poribacteria bacterium]|nr:ribulose-phosphate 3-epimerase [Candidatus Poribacteria bacterium]
MDIKVSTSIMCADFLRLGEVVKELENAGADYLHFDIMDGHFVPNFTMGPDMLKSIRNMTDVPFDTHLMVYDPERYVESFIQTGSDLLVIHTEACKHLHRTVDLIKQNGAMAGVAINPATPLSSLDYILEQVFMVLIMSVDPGFAGQKMIPSAIRKIRELRNKIDSAGLDVQIQVDGNVSFENAPKMVAAGAEILVAGSSSVFHRDMSIREGMEKLRQCVRGEKI